MRVGVCRQNDFKLNVCSKLVPCLRKTTHVFLTKHLTKLNFVTEQAYELHCTNYKSGKRYTTKNNNAMGGQICSWQAFFLKNFYRFENELLICRTHCTIKISTLKFQRNSEDQVEILKVKLKFRLNSSNTKKRIKNCPLRRFQRRNFASPPIKFSGYIPATEVLLIEQQQQRHLKITLMLFFIFFLVFFFSPRRGKSTHPSYSSPSST